jgi:hypothetical protein
MRQTLKLLGVLLFLAVSAGAQGPPPAGVGAGSGSTGGSRPFARGDFASWQVSLGYQYNKINLIGTPFNTNGLNADIVRYFGRWFGVEGQFGVGFGNTGSTSTPPNLGVHSLFAGGGVRLAYRNHSRIEPWVHIVAGVDDFRFTQTAGVLGNNTGLGGNAGGGVDYFVGRHMAVRVEADVMGSRFFSTEQRHFQAVSGLVFNF